MALQHAQKVFPDINRLNVLEISRYKYDLITYGSSDLRPLSHPKFKSKFALALFTLEKALYYKSYYQNNFKLLM